MELMPQGSEVTQVLRTCPACAKRPTPNKNEAQLEVEYITKRKGDLSSKKLHSCGHDTKVQRELEVLEDHESQMCFEFCKKNVGHKTFYSVGTFTKDKLPIDLQDPEIFKCIQCLAPLTVKLEIQLDEFDDQNNKKFRTGSGSLYIAESQYESTCPCDECKQSITGPKAEFRYIRVTTAKHVIGNDEAKKTRVWIGFEDDRDRSKIKYLLGHSLVRSDENADRCILECITHDLDLYNWVLKTRSDIRDLERRLKSRYGKKCPNLAVIISHPHGVEKKISFGKITNRYIRTQEDCGPDRQRTSFDHNVPTCKGSSGAVLWILGLERVGYMDHMITDHTHSDGGITENKNSSGEGLEWEFPNIEELEVHNHEK
ncbi:hypothetical protein Bpfe_001258 [Biomphalaria pfeifferi]|uniref:Uncharacterized protein n=2 Tax=Biomphalaria pfeifferi TaxID=112525 RepID=A0AAD8C9V8_BIOPF|nr:hypothetical protein Bpfe_001258 [Biomphalaria pfeifferi]